MRKQQIVLFYLLFIANNFFIAQPTDTVKISLSNINISNLKTGTANYLVYFKKDKDAPSSDVQIWNITTKTIEYKGQEAISITQNWNFKDTIVHTSNSICTKKSFQPMYHESWWKGRGKETFNVATKELSINDKLITVADSLKRPKSVFESFKTSFGKYYLNWHLDLEVFTMLPYKMKTTFVIPFYEFGYNRPEGICYTVTGTTDLETFDNVKVKCWILKHEGDGNLETYWISMKTKEVLKLEQIINGKIYRYKIKLTF